MSELNTLKDLLTEEIKDLFSAENQLLKALPEMAKAASDEDLVDAFTSHLEETKDHVERLGKAAKILGVGPHGKSCKAMQGLIEEGEEIIKQEGDPALRDLALIIAAQKVEHYEISAYGSAKALADNLGMQDILELLDTTSEEEGSADKKLTTISEQIRGSLKEEMVC